MGKSWKVATFNANSIRVRLPMILSWLEEEAPDALCIQETRVQDRYFPRQPFEEKGWHVTFRGQKAQAGVAVISRSKPQEVSFGFEDGGPADEPRLIRLTLDGIPLVNTYVPQGQSIDSEVYAYKLEWFARLRRLFEQEYQPDRPLLWCGDFNVAPEPIDVYDPERLKDNTDFHIEARKALEEVRRWGFVDIFRQHHPKEAKQYTFWDYRMPHGAKRNLGWRIDHIWTTAPLAEGSTACWIDKAPRLLERPSDHTFLVAQFDLDVGEPANPGA